MYEKKRGSALVITLFIAMILSIVALTTMERVVPISRITKGIENGNAAYYLAYSGVEDALSKIDKNNPGTENTFGWSFSATKNGNYQLTALTTKMPISGGGNSEYDTNWNRIAQNEPLDLMLPTTLSISNFTIRFRIPNVSPSTSETLTGNGGSGAILWSITSENFQAYSSGEVGMITNDNINNAATITVANKLGFDPVSTNSSNLSNFFASKCVSGTGCTIKFSLVRPLALASPANTPIPYLEYQITVNGGQKIPNQYATIQAQGSSAGFSQSILRNVRQKTSVTGTEFATVN